MGKDEKTLFTVRELDRPTRLDRVVRDNFPGWGRRAVQAHVNAGKASVNGKKVWMCSWQVDNGDRVEISKKPERENSRPKDFNDDWIIAGRDDVIAINKPAGILSHATRRTIKDDLLNLASVRFGPLYLFHRLDRDTSGVVIFTHPGPVNRYLDTAFKEGSIGKEYIALVKADTDYDSSGTIRARIGSHPKRRDMMTVIERGGRKAVTRYETLGEAEGKRLLLLRPETGRTHQLRVHMQYIGSPILGDRLYGGKGTATRLLLHARRIVLPDQDGFPERSFVADIPEDFLGEVPEELRALALDS